MIKIKISWIKSENDNKNFRWVEKFGGNVIRLDEHEKIDREISRLIKDKNDTIVITQEIAGFSEDIIKKYSRSKNVRIVINKS